MDFSRFTIAANATIVESMAAIDTAGQGIIFVCEDGVLLGTVTDGDIRRYILKNGALDAPTRIIANTSFFFLTPETVSAADKAFRDYLYPAIPVLNAGRMIVDILFRNVLPQPTCAALKLPVVIMAGGKGTRLYPYTQVLPKPLIPVGEKTIIEHIINKFVAFKCKDIKVIVNHKKEMIKAYFSEVETNANITFIDECVPMGTGGGLCLLREQITHTFFLSNCDILVDADYAAIYDYHRSNQNLLTMVCVAKTITVPYGTVVVDNGGEIAELREKPELSFLTNTGFYVIEPEFLNAVPENTFIHITDVIQQCMDKGMKMGVFPISEEHWSDMGQIGELEKMREKLGYT